MYYKITKVGDIWQVEKFEWTDEQVTIYKRQLYDFNIVCITRDLDLFKAHMKISNDKIVMKD